MTESQDFQPDYYRPSITSNTANSITWSERYDAYTRALNYFGERIVKGKLDLWITRYWNDGTMFVFELNSGVW